jgi:hypothetical protein
MYLIFLDFDGVIVPEQAYHYWRGREDVKRKSLGPETYVSAPRCCPIAISNLNYVLKNVPDCNIVISSTWRKHFSVDELKAFLTEDGFKYADRVLGCTPSIQRGFSTSSPRGTEIQKWIDECDLEITNWIAIDDNQYNIPTEKLIHTKQETGFTVLDAYDVISIFNAKWERPIFCM